jgi:hypothetical protein
MILLLPPAAYRCQIRATAAGLLLLLLLDKSHGLSWCLSAGLLSLHML